MSSETPPPLSPERARLRLNRAGIAILVLGLGWAAWIWRAPDQASNEQLPGTLSPEDSAKYQRQLEILSGKVGLLADRWRREVAELNHGKPLAESIAVVSLVSAAGCFALGALLRPR
jgi:hypothetical protein